MPFGLNPLTLERDVPIDETGKVVGPLADQFLRQTGFTNAWDYEASRDPTFKRPGAATTTQQAGAVAALLAALTAAGFNVGTVATQAQPAPVVLPPTIASFRKTFPQPSGRNWTNAELEAIRAAYVAKYGVDPGAHVWTAGNAPAPDYLSNRAIVPNAPAAPVAVSNVAAVTAAPAAITASGPVALSLTWQADYRPDMPAPADGQLTLGQLLTPNYLTRTVNRGGEEAETRHRILLDPNQVERSFREQVGVDIRTAIRDVAPGFAIPDGPVTLATLNAKVRHDQVRAPAKDDAFGPLLAAALIAATVATAGGAAAAGAAAGGAASGAAGGSISLAEWAAAAEATEAATGAAMLSNAGMTYADVLAAQALNGTLSQVATSAASTAASAAAQGAAGSAATTAATAAAGGLVDSVVRGVAGLVPSIVNAIRPPVAPAPVEPALVTLPPSNVGLYIIGGAVALLAVVLLAKGK